jgi:hypothetical protein
MKSIWRGYVRTVRYGGAKTRFKTVLEVIVGLGAFVMTLMNNRIPFLAIFRLRRNILYNEVICSVCLPGVKILPP